MIAWIRAGYEVVNAIRTAFTKRSHHGHNPGPPRHESGVFMCSRPAAALAGVLLTALLPAPASAVISDVQPIDGPSGDIIEIGGSAMSEDGSGGVVYLKRVGGRAHVFAAQFSEGEWHASQRVDNGQNFDSSWPRIAAGDRGRLVVTWVQEFGAGSDRLFSAALDPGATRFQAPVPIDFNVGEATATFPSLAMARGGQAYLTYRVITDTGSQNPPGFVGADVRVARYGGSLWSVLGSPIDRNPAIPVRSPTAENSPKVGIDIQGQGIVAFQEPDDDFVDRIYARRLFGSSVGIPLAVSPQTFDGAPLRGPADAFSLDVSGFGQGAVAFRQQPGEGGKLPGTRIFVNEIPDVFAETSGQFGGARIVDGEARAAPGAPSIAVTPRTDYLAGFSAGTATLAGTGNDETVDPVERLDGGGSEVAPEPLIDLAETGAAVAAWKDLRGGRGTVVVQERRADGVPELAPVSAARGGTVNRLLLGGSGLGDAIVAFHQGGSSFGQIAAVVVDAPPSEFFILLPDGWQRKRRVPISWDPSLNSVSKVTYSVSVDDEPVVDGLTKRKALLSRSQLPDGIHEVQIFAVDAAGQETGSQTGDVLVDRTRPKITLTRRGRALTVRVRDGRKGRSSGLRRSATRISFDDGKPARRPTARHRYGRRGTYKLVVRARDRAGNRSSLRRKLRVR